MTLAMRLKESKDTWADTVELDEYIRYNQMIGMLRISFPCEAQATHYSSSLVRQMKNSIKYSRKKKKKKHVDLPKQAYRFLKNKDSFKVNLWLLLFLLLL